MHVIPVLTLVLAVAVAPQLTAQQLRTVASTSGRALLARDLEARITALERAFARGNMTVVAGYYADNAQMISPSGHRPHVGRAQITRFWRKIEHPVSWDLETLDFGGTADEAWQLVRSSMVQGTGANLKPHVVRCLLVWRRQPDGSHRIHLDIWTEREPT